MSKITGDAPHGNTDSGNPLKIGGYAKDTAPTAVTAGKRVNGWWDLYGRLATFISGKAVSSLPTAATTGDRADLIADLFGRLRVIAAPPAAEQTTLRTNSSDQSGSAVACSGAPGSGKKLVIDNVIIGVGANMTVTLTEETSGTVVAVVHLLSGTSFRTGPLGMLATANKKLMFQTSASGAVNITVVSRSE